MNNTTTEDTRKQVVFNLTSALQAKLLKWLQAGASKDDSRPVLNAVRVEGDAIATADGWRMHVARAEDLPALSDIGTWQLRTKVQAAGGPVVAESEPCNYPNWRSIVTSETKHETTITIAFDPAKLRSILDGLDGMVTLEIHGEGHAAAIRGFVAHKGEKAPVYALIMPMHVNSYQAGDNEPTWTPSTTGNGTNG